MKLETLITKCVKAYPLRYASHSLALTRLRVLDLLYLRVTDGYKWYRGRLISTYPDVQVRRAAARPPLSESTLPLIAQTFTAPNQSLLFSDQSKPFPPDDHFVPSRLDKRSPLMLIPDDVQPDYFRGASEICAALEEYLTRRYDGPFDTRPQRLLLNELYARHGWEP